MQKRATRKERSSDQLAKRAGHRHGDLRRAVLDASLELIASDGVGALSMREVARRAGVTHGAPYHHFANRGAILAAVAEEGFVLLRDALRTATDGAPARGTAKFEACGQAYFTFALEHSSHFRVMFRPELSNPQLYPVVDALSGEAFQVLVECVLEAQSRGAAPKGDVLPLVLTSWATAHGLSALWVDGPLARRGVIGMGRDAQELSVRVAKTLGRLFRSGGKTRPKA